MALLAYTLLITLLFLLYKFIVHPVYLSPLAAIPAARWHARFCPLWILYIRWANIENCTVYKLHQKHGPIFLMGPSDLSVNCYEGGLKTIYAGGFPKTEFYTRHFKNYGHDHMFTMIDGKEHGQGKRLMANIYSKSVVLASPTVRVTSLTVLRERLLPIIQKSADVESPVEVLRLNFAYAMDSFMAFQFGLGLGSNMLQDIEERDWYLKRFFSRRPYGFWPTELPRLTALLRKLGIHMVSQWTDAPTESLEAWVLDKCDAAEKLVSSSSSTASRRPANDPGHGPAVFATVSQKLREADAKAAGPLGAQDHQQQHASPRLRSRRLALTADMFDHSAAALETSGYTLTWLHYELARRPVLQARVFPDPESWRPERWLEASADELAEMRRWFWAWGSGGRMCVGSHFAVNSMKLAIAAIYSSYTTSLYDAEGIEQGEGFIAGPKGNKLWLNFRNV